MTDDERKLLRRMNLFLGLNAVMAFFFMFLLIDAIVKGSVLLMTINFLFSLMFYRVAIRALKDILNLTAFIKNRDKGS
jgi:hypothetical protein